MDHFADRGPESWLFRGPTGANVTTRTLERHWAKARMAIGKSELRLYDMRHTGLTFVGSGGASLAELMRRGGHSSVNAALKYQHATDGRDEGVADGLARLAMTLEQHDGKRWGTRGARAPIPTPQSRQLHHRHLQTPARIQPSSTGRRFTGERSNSLFKRVFSANC